MDMDSRVGQRSERARRLPDQLAGASARELMVRYEADVDAQAGQMIEAYGTDEGAALAEERSGQCSHPRGTAFWSDVADRIEAIHVEAEREG
jgi:hypothetical protein